MKARSVMVALVCGLSALTLVPASPSAVAAAPQPPTEADAVPTTVQVVTGYEHTCALSSAGGVKCWGQGGNKAIGDGTYEDRLAPTDVVGLTSGVTSLSAGPYDTCAVLTTGSVRCWGLLSGASGDPNNPIPVTVEGLGASATEVTSGDGFACALLVGGQAKCWGANSFGQLGDGTTDSRTTPAAVTGIGSPIAEISAGLYHVCARTTSGAALCWGRGTYGALGDGTTSTRSSPAPVTGLSSGVTSIASGGANSCATITGGALKCWGANGEGQVGDGTRTGESPDYKADQPTPIDVVGLGSGVTAVSIGYALPESRVSVCVGSNCPPPGTVFNTAFSHVCALTTAGAVSCWGNNQSGMVGDGTTVSRSTPTPVPGLGAGVTSISSGLGFHRCAVASGSLKCWGLNRNGQLGRGFKGNPYWTPEPVTGLGGIETVTAGRANTCVRTTGGAVQCWGDNRYGQLGNGNTGGTAGPGPVTGLGSGVLDLSAGDLFSCAVVTGGGVKCWGLNSFGQLGDGTTTDRDAPVDVVGLGAPATDVVAGAYFACALLNTGAAKCWGWNPYGQLGDGTTTSSPTAVAVVGLPAPVKEIALRAQGTCALTTTGGVWCWGQNFAGQVGDGTTTDRLAPTAVTGLSSGVAHIAAGQSHGCAITAAGAAVCWGYNVRGQLGDGTTESRSTPTPVAGLGSGTSTISAGTEHTCALLATGSMQCWGQNMNGELGNGTILSTDEPLPVSGGTGIQAISAGSAHTCSLSTAGAVSCWGINVSRQIGPAPELRGLLPETASLTWSPISAPGAPTIGAATAGNGSATLAWSAPANDGASPITGYVVTPFIGSTAQSPRTFTSTATTQLITGLTNGTVYTFRVAATNAIGTGPASAASNAVTPTVPTSAPGAPTAVVATAGDQQATISWSAPASNGSSPITGYVITPFIGAVAQPERVHASSATTYTAGGLTNGTTYTFEVAATNAVGTGPRSTSSNAVSPADPYTPFPSWASFVKRQHLDLTTKQPTAAALNSWTTQLANGTKTKGDLADALRRGSENVANVDPVVRVYRAFLGRAPDAGGLKFWINRKRNVAPAKTWTVTQIATDFTKSNEFITKYGSLTNRQFVTRIYTDVLGRTADTAGVNYWTGKIDSKAKTKAQVMVGFSESNEYKTKQAQNTDVAVAYIYLMGRAPTTAEATDWVTRQKAGTTNAALLDELLSSFKYAVYIRG